MQYDSQEQKNVVMNALSAFSVPLGQRSTIDPVVTQLAQGEVVAPSKPEKPEKPSAPASLKSVKKGGKKK